MNINTQVLEKIGLTKGEIKVYFSLVELGESSSGPIILHAKVSRSKVYEVLEKLKEKGLVSEVIKENTKYFQAADPKQILEFIKDKEKELTDYKLEFITILPKLEDMQKLKEDKQELKVYSGIEGVKTFYNEILNSLNKGDEYLAMSFPKEALQYESLIYMFQDFHKRRGEKGIRAKILTSEKKELSKKGMNFSHTKYYEFRQIESVLPTGLAIFNDTVATFNWGKVPRVFVIICKENADQYKKFFYNLWDKAKK